MDTFRLIFTNKLTKVLDLFGREIKYSKLEFSEKYFPEYLIKNKSLYKYWII